MDEKPTVMPGPPALVLKNDDALPKGISTAALLWTAGCAILVVGVLLVGSWWLPDLLALIWPGWFKRGLTLDERAQLGTAVGLAGVLFSALTVVGVIVAIAIQSVELRHQQFEVRRTVAALDRQQEANLKQEIENHVFQLLGALREVVAGTTFAVGAQPLSQGRAAFAAMLESFRHGGMVSGRTPIRTSPAQIDDSRRLQLARQYRDWYDKFSSDQLGHYFRLLYHTVLYIHDQAPGVEVRKHYIRLVRAHLSDPELVLLCYNGLTPRLGFEGFYPLIERYRLLANVSPSDLLDSEDIAFYPRNREAIDPSATTSEQDLVRMFGSAVEHARKTFCLGRADG